MRGGGLRSERSGVKLQARNLFLKLSRASYEALMVGNVGGVTGEGATERFGFGTKLGLGAGKLAAQLLKRAESVLFELALVIQGGV